MILDPACGTAGFLISGYKHILRTNIDAKNANTLTPDEKGRLAKNFQGYDISPDMVRLSLVNLYLHGFTDPHVFEYDTLTSDERWNDFADVILANPPFMSPKGGIKPHKRFSIQAKRSEVLFVDYMAEHLTPTGRAGIIVPEGIIFQSQTAYKELRKMLVENSLVAVISLPAGVFQPYSGVKTSILILDKSLAKQCDTVAFFKVENDGFGLGAQRRANDGEQLTQVQMELAEYLRVARSGGTVDDLQLSLGLVVAKEKIAANGDFGLSGERYREGAVTISSFPFIQLSEVARVKNGFAFKSDEYVESGLRVIRIKNVQKGDVVDDDPKFMAISRQNEFKEYMLKSGDVLMSLTGNVGRVGKLKQEHEPAILNQRVAQIQLSDNERYNIDFLFALLNTDKFESDAVAGAGGVAQANLSSKWVGDYLVPLPPLEVQKEIVAEIEGYQKVIKGARAVLDNYRPHIPIHPDWPMVELGEYIATGSGGTPSKQQPEYWIGDLPWVSPKDMKVDFLVDTEDHISETAISNSATKLVPSGALLCVVRSGILQHTFPVALTTRPMAFNQDLVAIQPKGDDLDIRYLFYIFKDKGNEILLAGIKPGVTVQSFHNGFFKTYQLALPPLATQQAIVAEIEAEQALVNANRELIERFEKKIQATLARVWGEEEQVKGDHPQPPPYLQEGGLKPYPPSPS